MVTPHEKRPIVTDKGGERGHRSAPPSLLLLEMVLLRKLGAGVALRSGTAVEHAEQLRRTLPKADFLHPKHIEGHEEQTKGPHERRGGLKRGGNNNERNPSFILPTENINQAGLFAPKQTCEGSTFSSRCSPVPQGHTDKFLRAGRLVRDTKISVNFWAGVFAALLARPTRKHAGNPAEKRLRKRRMRPSRYEMYFIHSTALQQKRTRRHGEWYRQSHATSNSTSMCPHRRARRQSGGSQNLTHSPPPLLCAESTVPAL